MHIDDEINLLPPPTKEERGFTTREMFIIRKLKNVAKRSVEKEIQEKVRNDLRDIIRLRLLYLIIQMYISLTFFSYIKFTFI